jgi:hypothetical protein
MHGSPVPPNARNWMLLGIFAQCASGVLDTLKCCAFEASPFTSIFMSIAKKKKDFWGSWFLGCPGTIVTKLRRTKKTL